MRGLASSRFSRFASVFILRKNEVFSIRVIVTAGPTIEPIDPVRFISNRSTGYMGYRLAQEAVKRRHRVTLISGPTQLSHPKVNKFIPIQTAEQLLKTLKREIKDADCLVMCAAVSDFRPAKTFKQKIKRQKKIIIEFLPNKDILSEIKRFCKHSLFVGFSLETEDLLKSAYLKLKSKDLDLLVANRVTKYHNPFGNKKLDALIIDRFRNITRFKQKNKTFLAQVLLDKIERMWYLKNKKQEV